MSYDGGLKALRAKMLSQATGKEVAEERGVESFISSRGNEQPQQESSQDILSRGATWLADIRKASAEFKAANEAGNAYTKISSGGTDSGVASAMDSLARGLSSKVGGKEEEATPEERKEAFIAKRSDSSPSSYAPRRGGEPVPKEANIRDVLDALAAVESRGSGDYAAVGPKVNKGMYKGQRAYGRYQVMEGNIAPWTKAAIGKPYTKEEFLSNEAAQDAVAAHQLQKSFDKYGTWEDAASVWFSGRPFTTKNTANDDYTSVPEYINKFRRNFVR